MTAAGFKDYAAFVKAIYSAVQEHARRNGWIPVYYNLGDEPIGDDADPLGRECRGVPAGVPQGPALLHGGQQLHRQRPAGPSLPALEGPARRRAGTTTTRPRVNLLHDVGQRLGLLQRRQPLDLRHLHVQGREAVRHEVPALLALERRGRRPVLRARLPRGRLRLVQRLAGRPAHPVGRVRAAARGAGRLSPADHAGPPGDASTPAPRPPGPPAS